MTHRCHAVLAVVSHGYPPPKDRYLRVTHPSATDSRSCPCDLHVLSMPPAFALSQDQTLRFITATQPQKTRSPQRTIPRSNQPSHAQGRTERPLEPTVIRIRRIRTAAAKQPKGQSDHKTNPADPTKPRKPLPPTIPHTTQAQDPNHSRTRGAPPTYPFR